MPTNDHAATVLNLTQAVNARYFLAYPGEQQRCTPAEFYQRVRQLWETQAAEISDLDLLRACVVTFATENAGIGRAIGALSRANSAAWDRFNDVLYSGSPIEPGILTQPDATAPQTEI
jgi:hypothetical protein